MKNAFLLLLVTLTWINIYGQTADDYFKQGNAKYLKNDFIGADKDFSKAIELNPKFFNAYINRGRLRHNKLDDDKSAIKDYNKAIELDPKSANAYYYRANAYRNLKEFKKACADWTKAAELGNMDAKGSLSKYCK
jgi:tetratricopeptide (TPR) repeat protein